jgi:hypothetical protein
MHRDEFALLDIPARVQLLWNEGEVISEKRYYECNITLFLISDFYVEVFFNVIENEVVSVSVQDNAQILYGYVTEVSLKELENLLQ